MLDKSIPSQNIFMEKFNLEDFPRYPLAEGYAFSFYRPGDEREWARIEYELGQFDTVERGIEIFNQQFLREQRLKPEERMIFVKNSCGKIVATAALWEGEIFGRLEPRIHWVATSDSCAGKGIAKAMLTRLFELCAELGYKRYIYLWTGTRSYPAINIYRKFGFKEYIGDTNPITNTVDEDFAEKNRAAVDLAGVLIQKYKLRKSK